MRYTASTPAQLRLQFGQPLRQIEQPQLVIAHVVHPEGVGGVEQHARVGRNADAIDPVLERQAIGARVFDRLQERRAGTALRLPAQVEVGIEVDDRQPRPARADVPRQAQIAGIGDLVAAAQAHGQMPRVQQAGHGVRIARLRGFEVAIGAGDGAGVVQRRLVQHRQVGQHPAQRGRPLRRAHAAVIAAHALVAGEAQQRNARCGIRRHRAHPLVPAPGASVFRQIDAPPSLPGTRDGPRWRRLAWQTSGRGKAVILGLPLP
ncbi:hypothetical protein [Thermomonas sp. S9]|uniref:hypothetical protein n=1 Tax=Thermomonas sp. S9 TaxID=2885203 RepID=UPI00216AB910|nr:hypothetical protein [Thermomonas sp. S9]